MLFPKFLFAVTLLDPELVNLPLVLRRCCTHCAFGLIWGLWSEFFQHELRLSRFCSLSKEIERNIFAVKL